MKFIFNKSCIIKLIFFLMLFFCFQISTCFANRVFLVNPHGNYGYINEYGEPIIGSGFDSASRFCDGLALVYKNNECYIIGITGTKIASVDLSGFGSYRSIGTKPFINGIAVLSLSGIGYGFINTDGKLLNNKFYKYKFAYEISNNRQAVKIDDKWGFIDKNGDLIIPNKFKLVMPFTEGIAHVKKDGLWGFINTEGKYLVKPKYIATASGSHSEGLSLVIEKQHWKYVDKYGTKKIDFNFYKGSVFSEGLAAVIVDGKAGYIDKSGTLAIKNQYDDAAMFSGGLASVEIDDKWGFIDINGKMIIKPQFDTLGYFKNGLAQVYQDGEHYFVDRKGKTIWKYPSDEED